VPVWGDAEVIAAVERWAIWRAEKQSHVRDDRGDSVASPAMFAAMNRLTPHNAVIAIDVGNTPTPSAATSSPSARPC
jgi:thiamine pyrophosphate-dependent acetolactate synthase large subunit-like protein